MNELERSSAFQPGQRDAFPEPSVTIHDLALILWRRLWIIVLIMAVSVLTAATLSKRTPKAWRANAQVLLVQRGPMLAPAGQTTTFMTPMVETIDTQITLMQSRELAKQAAQKVGISADTLLSAATVSPRHEGDNVMDVTVEAGSRQEAINWTNALCQAFVEYKKQVAQRASQDEVQTLQTEAAQARKAMGMADLHLMNFQKSHQLSGIGIMDPLAQKTAALNAVFNQQAVIANLENESATAEAKASALSSQLHQANAAIQNSTGVRDDPEVTKLQESLHDLQQQRNTMALKYKSKFPGKLAPLDAQIAYTRAQLSEAIQNLQKQPSLEALSALQQASNSAQSDAQSARVRLAAAIQQLHLLQNRTQDLPSLSLEAANLMDNADQAHKLYNSLSAAVQTAQLNTDVASGNVQIVQPAFAPDDPFRPSHKRDILVGVGIGVCLSLLAVLLLEQGDRSLRTAADVRRLASGPVVAVLPQMTRAQQTLFKNGETPPHLIETYNAARANLSLAMRQLTGQDMDEHQVILVTSAIPGEGKSLTATELAQSYARAGRRVVLIDADMRRHSALPLLRPQDKSVQGLAEVLLGETRVEDVLVASKTANLSVLYSGYAAQNPMDLISQTRMAETMQSLREMADVVIMDSPPAAVVADALLLAPYADCVLVVVGVGMADSENVRQTAAALAAASPKMLAYFVNRVPHLIGEPSSYTYSDYGLSAAAPSLPDGTRDYQASRTMMLDRPYTPEQSSVTEAANSNGHVQTDGAASSLRVLPKVGSRLTTLEGPYVGQSFALSSSKPLTLGSLPDRDIVLARDVTVSHLHARIVPEEDGYVIFDDGSTNGTLINDVPVQRHVLEVGDVVQLGASKFRYE